MTAVGEPQARPAVEGAWLLAATFVVAVAGLVYELIAGAVASYLLGDSITQFSLVIGVFMSAMGLGAWASRFVDELERGFVAAQVLLGLIGGFSAPAMFLAYGWLDALGPALFGSVIAIGVLSGLEIPLITRILQRHGALRTTLSSVLTADYAGALAAAILFPALIVPQLGLMAASLFFGLLNLGVAALSIWLFRDRLGWALPALWAGALTACLAGFVASDRLVAAADAARFEDEVILSEATPYQRIVVTRTGDRTRLFLDGAIQFDSFDEHRYHESLVHPAMGLASRRARVLVLGGGDGMALREVLRWPEVEVAVLVDLDPRMTALFRDRADLSRLNGRSLSDPRVTVVNRDAWRFVDAGEGLFDIAILDLPDPSTFAVSKLYSREFYNRLAGRMAANGMIVTQAGSPLFARRAFWSVERTLGAVENPYRPGATLPTLPYHAYVPSFGDWGFVLAPLGALRGAPAAPPDPLGFWHPDLWSALQRFPADTGPVAVETNSILSHALVDYYEAGWARWFPNR
ncbi:MAG: polyamine aminopropyltransferase [Pseudomonadota bacterium]